MAVRATVMRSFVPKSLMCWSDNLSSDIEGGIESKRATEGVTEGSVGGRSRRGRLRPWTEVLLELISFKTLFQMGWLTCWVWKN